MKYLCNVIGANMVRPMLLLGNIDKLVEMLTDLSKQNTYEYALYIYSETLDSYYPYYSFYRGIAYPRNAYTLVGGFKSV